MADVDPKDTNEQVGQVLLQEQGGVMLQASPRVTLERALEVAQAVAGGDPQHLKNKNTVIGLAVAVLAFVAAASEIALAAEERAKAQAEAA